MKKSFDSILSEDESLLPNIDDDRSSIIFVDEETRDKQAVSAVKGLMKLYNIVTGTIIMTIAIAIFERFSKLPQYLPFVVLFVGNGVAAVQIARIVILAHKSLFIPILPGQNVRGGIEKRLMFAKYALYNLGTYLSLSSLIIVFLFLVFLCTEGWIKTIYTLIPLYLLSMCGFIMCMLLRSANVSLAISFFTIFLTSLLLNLKLNVSPLLAWTYVALPVYVYLLFWIIELLTLFANYVLDDNQLQSDQIKAIGMYLLSFGSLFLCTLSFTTYYRDIGDRHRSEIFPLSSLLFGLLMFFSAYGTVLKSEINSFVGRMGNSKPQPLIRVDGGGWGEDRSTNIYNHLLLGDINIATSQDRLIGRYITRYVSHKLDSGNSDRPKLYQGDVENSAYNK